MDDDLLDEIDDEEADTAEEPVSASESMSAPAHDVPSIRANDRVDSGNMRNKQSTEINIINTNARSLS